MTDWSRLVDIADNVSSIQTYRRSNQNSFFWFSTDVVYGDCQYYEKDSFGCMYEPRFDIPATELLQVYS